MVEKMNNSGSDINMDELVKYKLFFNNYLKELKKTVKLTSDIEETDKNLITPKIVFLAVKTMILKPPAISNEEILSDFNDFVTIKDMISYLTPNEFVNIFPVSKEYDGERYEVKDYFYTMEYINGLIRDEPIGDIVMEFLMEYTNEVIWQFNILGTSLVNELRKADGHIDMFEEFMARNGVDTPNTFKNSKGKPMYIKNGRPEEIKTKNNNHLVLA